MPAPVAPAPADSDGDGVVDASDKGPNTPAGRKVNAMVVNSTATTTALSTVSTSGPRCTPRLQTAARKAPPQKRVLEGVSFGSNQAVLQADSFAALDEAAATLKEWGDVRVGVAGYTDSVGRPKRGATRTGVTSCWRSSKRQSSAQTGTSVPVSFGKSRWWRA